jgi:hypothetical protein
MKRRARKEPTQLLTKALELDFKQREKLEQHRWHLTHKLDRLLRITSPAPGKEDRRQNRDTKNEPMRLPG